jgi:2,4-didehydro-3-deoxy-L-rhamnonate hydrolase
VDPERIVLAQGRLGGESGPWLVADARALPLGHWSDAVPLGRVGSITELLQDWTAHEAGLYALTTSRETRHVIHARGADVGALTLDAPLRPTQVFCTIGNYRRQVVEAAVDAEDGPSGPNAGNRLRAALDGIQRREAGEPYVCLTSNARVAPPLGTLPIHADTLDWEVEIAAVLGVEARDVTPEEARSVIAGYCTANDVTVRSRVPRADLPALGSDWIQSKGMPGTLPLGPWFVPAWQVPDLASLRLRLTVNGELMQDDVASDMLFNVEQQVSYLSRYTQLQAGDVICTGSPAGFGAHHGRFLRTGDVVTAEVSELGWQQLTCIAESLTGEGESSR